MALWDHRSGHNRTGQSAGNVERAPAAGVSENGSGGVGKIVYDLNPALVDWAYGLTRQIELADSRHSSQPLTLRQRSHRAPTAKGD